MDIVIASYSDRSGGAAKASFRLASALHSQCATNNIHLMTNEFSGDEAFVYGETNNYTKLLNLFRIKISESLLRLQKTPNTVLHSLNVLPSNTFNRIHNLSPDIVNLHWINREFISIKQISKIQSPMVMTLHDMWAFCGAEHYINPEDKRYINGYFNRFHETGININSFVWKKKLKYWKDFQIVTPSRWLSECARNSYLFNDFNIATIPNAINTGIFKPLEKNYCRSLFNLNHNVKMIGFGAIGGARDERKGFDLLIAALKKTNPNVECIVFGQSKEINIDIKCKFISVGHISDDYSLAALYNCLDVMIVPSRLEAFGQTASEAIACGIPVVSFDTSGLKDIVDHHVNGYRAELENSDDLAAGVDFCLGNNFDSSQLHLKAVNNWSYEVIARKYNNLYTKIINNN
ncbi:glycosyltransferase [Symbiopectobacterium purcellii]|uniref:glycosyltransferase n=1 Tax=Symbiopectobacterium purcellii TaxID=2871826 RepID=UPI003F8493F1